MQSSIKTDKELETFYNSLTENYEGYIQMSNNTIEHIFKSAITLPKWEELHNGVNYILELALFEPTNKKSILVRQANREWVVLEKKLTDTEIQEADSFFTIKDGLQAKIAQIWEEQKDEFCLNMKVLESKCLLFAGFAEKKGEA